MKLLFDLFPLLVFFAAYKLSDIYVATAAAIVATVLQIAWLKLRRQPVDTMLWVGLVLIVVFGGATLVLKDPTFIRLKPSVLYWLFAAILGGADLLLGKNPMRALLGNKIEMPAAAWRRLNLSWAAFFAVMGALNLYVAFSFSETIWVNFKVFGTTALMLVFIIIQAVWLARLVPSAEEGKSD
jgi:intracellular septation protein